MQIGENSGSAVENGRFWDLQIGSDLRRVSKDRVSQFYFIFSVVPERGEPSTQIQAFKSKKRTAGRVFSSVHVFLGGFSVQHHTDRQVAQGVSRSATTVQVP